MTDDIDNDGTTLHESGGVVQPTDAQIDALWTDERLSTPQIVKRRSIARAVLALAVPQAPLQAEPVPVVASEPIYQLRNVFVGESQSTWHDASEKAYDFHPDKDRRIVYATPQAEPAVAEQARNRFAAHTDLLTYVLQDDVHNRLTPRVIDIAYTAFMSAKQPNTEDSGSSDWFNDTRPTVRKAIDKLREALFADRAALASQSTPPPESAGLLRAVRYLDEKRASHDHEHAVYDPETGATEFGRGPRAEALEEYSNTLADLSEELRAILAANPTAPPDGGSKA